MSSNRKHILALVFLLAAVFGPTGSVQSKVFHSQIEALQLEFPGADRFAKKTHILTAEQTERIEKLARSELESRLVTIHSAWQGERLLGYAHIDVHTVRTKPEGFMVALSPNGRVESVRILAFYEPLDYLPTGRWYDQFHEKSEQDRLSVGWDIDAVSGATLSARAATSGVRRMLAYYQILLRTARTD